MAIFDLFIPHIAYAADSTLSVKDIMYRISYSIINPLIQVGFAVALIFLVWKIVIYVKEKNSGKIFQSGTAGQPGTMTGDNGIYGILWGLLGLFIMTSAFIIMRYIATWLGSDIATP